MQVVDVRTGRKIELEQVQETRVPWQRQIVVGFEGFNQALLSAERDDIKLSGFHLGVFGGFVTGILKHLPPPMQLFHHSDALLSALFEGFADQLVHSGHFPPHPLVHQVPDGQVGAGLLLVRNASLLSFGPPPLPSSNVEKQALIRTRAAQTLKELGFVTKPSHPDPGTVAQ